MPHLLPHLSLLALLLGGAPAPEPRAAERVVLVPFENASGAALARGVIMPAVEAALAAKGYQAVSGTAVEAFLQARRIRWLDSLTPSQAVELLTELKADAVLVGTILAWEPAARDPAVALAARLVGPKGDLLWTGLGGLTALGTEGVFGLGRATTREALAQRAVEALLEPLPRDRLAEVAQPRPGDRRGPRVFRAREAAGPPLRVAVLPLLNLTEERRAARSVDAALHQRLAGRPGLSVVEPAELRAAVVAGRLRAPGLLSPDQLKALGRLVGTSLFLRGTILGYGRDEVQGVSTPMVELHLALVDVESGRTLWSGLHRRTGLDYEGLLRTGQVLDAATLAGRVVGELLESFTRR